MAVADATQLQLHQCFQRSSPPSSQYVALQPLCSGCLHWSGYNKGKYLPNADADVVIVVKDGGFQVAVVVISSKHLF